MSVTALVLMAILAYSWRMPPIRFGYFSHPPLYGVWRPVLHPLALTVIPAALVLAALAWTVTSRKRVPTGVALLLIVGAGVAAAASIALVRGHPRDLVRRVSRAYNAPAYTSDQHFVSEYGVRGFVEQHAHLIPQFHAYNSKTHPAGIHVILFGLFKVFDSHHLAVATAIAALGLSAAVSAWSMGRILGGERSGRIAAVLFMAAPGPLMLAYTSMDAVYATFLSASAALFMIAIYGRSARMAAAAGAVLAVATLLTFASVFVGIAAVAAVAVQTRSPRDALRLLGAAAAAGLGVLVLAWLALGFDVLASYRAGPGSSRTYNPYWIVGSPAAWLIYAGLPLAALGVVGLFRNAPGARRAVFPLIIVLIMLAWAALPPTVTKLRPGEVERTWAFLYPILAASAGPVIDRWTNNFGRWSGAVVAALVVLSIGQAALVQASWNTVSS